MDSPAGTNTASHHSFSAGSDASQATMVTTEPSQPEIQQSGGYAELGGFMSHHPELSILRRFGAIGTESLLLRQAQLAVLERRLRRVQAEDRESESSQLYDKSWLSLSGSSVFEDGDRRREQLDLIMLIRDLKLRYDQALFFHRETLSLRRPHKKLLEDLRDWMHRPDRGHIQIVSCDYRTWDPESNMDADLVTFEDSTMDGFTSLIVYNLVDVFHKYIWKWIHRKSVRSSRNERDAEKTGSSTANATLPVFTADLCPTKTYSNAAIIKFTRTITVLLACLLPIGAIPILYSVHDTAKKLGIIACMTGLFSVVMNLFTTATLSEIFQATAAFAAILVVFISGAGGGQGG